MSETHERDASHEKWHAALESSADPVEPKPKRDLLMLQAGAVVQLRDGSLRTIISNPADGVWLVLRDAGGGDEELVPIADVVGPAEPPARGNA